MVRKTNDPAAVYKKKKRKQTRGNKIANLIAACQEFAAENMCDEIHQTWMVFKLEMSTVMYKGFETS